MSKMPQATLLPYMSQSNITRGKPRFCQLLVTCALLAALLCPATSALAGVAVTGNVTPTSPAPTDPWNLGGNSLFVGNSGTGTLDVTAGGKVTNGYGYVGNGSSSNGTVKVDGTNSIWQNNGNLYVGSRGTGKLDVTAGGKVTNSVGYVGYDSGSDGTVKVDGTNSIWQNSGSLYVGLDGTGTLDVTAGGKVINRYGYVGSGSGSNGTVKVDGTNSIWQNNYDLYVGNYGTGKLDVTAGGKVTAGRELRIGNNGTVNLTDGEIKAATMANTVGGAFNFTGGRLNITNNTGTGTFYGSLTQNGGTLAAGNSPGTMNITQGYLQNAGSLEVEIAGPGTGTAGVNFDFYNVTGNATLNGSVDIKLLSSYTPTAGEWFDVLKTSGTLTANGLTLNAPAGFNFDYSVVDGNTLRLQALANAAELGIDPTEINFGTVITGASVAGQDVTVTETGGNAGDYEVNSPGSPFSVSDAGSNTVAADGTNTHTVDLDTSTVGTFSDNVKITSDDTDPALDQDVAVSAKVLEHASPTQDKSTIDLGTVIVGAPEQSATATFGNADHPDLAGGEERADLEVTGTAGLSGPLDATGVSAGDKIAAGDAKTLTFTGQTGTVGAFNQTGTVSASDDMSIPGHTPTADTDYDVSLTVLDHSHASFSGSSIDTSDLEIALGDHRIGDTPLPSSEFDVFNFGGTFGDDLTADMEFLGIFDVSGDTDKFDITALDGLEIGNLIEAGDDASFLAALVDDGMLGEWEATFRLDFQDEDLPGAGDVQSLFVTLSAQVVPEPASIAIWSLLGLALAGFGVYRRRAK